MPRPHEGGIESYPLNFMRCRARRHAWDNEHWSPITDGRGRQVGWLERVVCLRCEQPKHREYDMDLWPVTSGKIDYEDGYLAAPGEPIQPVIARRMLVRIATRTIAAQQTQPLEA